MDDGDTSPPPTHGQSSSPLAPTKRTPLSSTHDQAIRTQGPIPWKMTPTVILRPVQPSKSSKHNPFHNKSREIRPTVFNGSSDLPAVLRPKFHSDWNLGHLKEKKRKPESSLPFKVDSKGKPLVPVVLGSRQRMSSRS